jgi:tetratricopeptide (TPR) repeat protein
MRTISLLLICLCAQSLTALPTKGAESFAENDQTKAAAAKLASQADAKLREASSPQNYQEAAMLLEKSVALDPDNLEVRRTLGWVYLDKLHDPHKAYPHLAKAVKIWPDDVEARKLFGMACSQTGRPHQAVEEFRAASALKPDDLWIRAALARSLARVGKLSEAEAIYADVLHADPGNVDARLGEAEIQAWRGHTAGPLQTLDQLAQENPGRMDVLTLRGDIYRWDWDLTKARQDYQSVLTAQPNDYDARSGLLEAKRLGATSLGVHAYKFTDTTDFEREYLEANGRIHLSDRAYLIGGVAGWRFKSPGFSDLDRLDGNVGLEYHFARWLDVAATGNVYDYENRSAFFGGTLSSKISPMTGTDFFVAGGYNQPFISSISTVEDGLREHTAGLGLDTRLGGRFSFQAAAQVAHITDDNNWVDVKPQLSYRLLDKLATYLRVQYEYLDYSESRTNYWTPHNRSTLGPVLDTAIPLWRGCHLVADAKAPYVFEESKFGYQIEGGPEIELFHQLVLKASYYYSDIPGDEGAWSGHGWQASLQLRF